jgi:alpha-galactosidase
VLDPKLEGGDAVKITMVGGGSYSWGPLVVGNILGNEQLEGSEVVLYDLDREALDLNCRLALRYRDRAGSSTSFSQTTDRTAALDGADFVVVAISTGGLRAMRVDLEVPERYDIFQTVGDTVGPGGAARTLRNVPVFVDLARAMEEHCPRAWMLNCSNPLSALTRVVNRETGIRALGLCHGVHGQVRLLADFFGRRFEDCVFVNTGIDHCSWLTELRIDGRDAGEMLLERGVEKWLAMPAEEAAQDETFGALKGIRCGLLLWRILGVLPAIGDRHLVEFFPGFLDGMDHVTRHGLERTTIADRERSRRRARERMEEALAGDPLVGCADRARPLLEEMIQGTREWLPEGGYP